MKFRILSLLLALALMCGCASALAEAPAMSDVAGMTAPGVLPIVTEPLTLVLALTQESNVTDLDTNEYTRYLEELSGVDLSFFVLPTEETAQKVDLMIASNEKLPDIFFSGITDKYYYGSTGVLLSLNEYMEKYAYFFNETLDTYATESEKTAIFSQMPSADGNVYAFPFVSFDSPSDGGENILYINQRWLDALSLDMPATTDELYEVLIAFRDSDPNGNGKADEIPMMGYASYDRRGDVVGDLINAFTYYPYIHSGTYQQVRLVVEDGVVATALTKDEYREGLRFCKKLYDEGLIAPQSFTQAADQLKTIIDRPASEPSVVGVVATHPGSGLCGWAGGYSDEYNKVMEYEALPCLTGPEGASYAARVVTGYYMTTSITKDCEHPEVAFRLLDLMTRADVSLNARYGAEGDAWEYAAEGDLDVGGNQALYVDLKAVKGESNYWGAESQNAIWRIGSNYISLSNTRVKHMENANPYTEHSLRMLNAGLAMRDGHQPAEIYSWPIYTEDELAVVDDLGAMLKTTADEWRTLFVTGEKSLDTDWDAYIAQLEALGLEDYLAAAQSCYTRMTSEN